MGSAKGDKMIVGYDLSEDGESYTQITIWCVGTGAVSSFRADRPYSRRELVEAIVEHVRRVRPASVCIRIGADEREHELSKGTVQDILDEVLGVDDLLVGS